MEDCLVSTAFHDLCTELEKELSISQNVEKQSCCDGRSLALLWDSFLQSFKDSEAAVISKGQEASSRAVNTSPEIVAVLAREPGRCRYGLEFAAPVDSGILLLTDAEPSSSADMWNDLCSRNCEPWKRLHLGCAVVSINGVIGNTRRMQHELEANDAAKVIFRNPPTLSDAAFTLCAVRGLLPFTHLAWTSRLKNAGTCNCDEAVDQTVETEREAPNQSEDVLDMHSTETVNDISIIITTSPVPSNPSTGMLEVVLKSFELVPGLPSARKIIVCDGCKQVQQGQKPRHKAGKVLADDAAQYREFIERVREKVECESDCFRNSEVLELEDHYGFGHAVKHALQLVSTSFVLVVQHDQQFIHGFDLQGVLHAMSAHPQQLKYVGLCSNTTQNYVPMVLSKFRVTVSRTVEFGIPLVPLVFFYDKPHICSVAHYRNFVFGEHSLVERGDFIEETLGKAQRADIVANGMQAHSKYGTWQLDEVNEAGESIVVVRHVNGRAFLTPEQRVACGWPACLRFRV